MKRIFLAAALCAASPAAQAQSALEWATQGMAHNRVTSVYPKTINSGVQRLIAEHVSTRIGPQWVGTALRIAKIESGFRCNARNRRAVGIFQNTNPAMFGVSRAAALTCEGGVRAGVAHMAMCIGKGARTSSQMMRCHNSGSPFGRVEKAYRVALRGE